jgi:uncharacterized protein with gpF-like domain
MGGMIALPSLQARKIYINWHRREAKLVKYEDQISNIWKRSFRAELPLVIKALRDHSSLVAAAEPYKPIIVNIRSTQARVQVKTVKTLKAALRQAGQTMAQDTAIASGMQFPGFPKQTQKFLDSYVPKIVADIGKTTRKMILTQIKQGVKKGETLKQIAGRIRSIYSNFSEQRAYRIARHETGMIAFQSEYDMFAAMPIDKSRLFKTWHNAQDEKVRDQHEIENETRRFNEKFSNGLRFPMDPEGEIGNTAGCRCFLSYRAA